jgi:hypothetical protein
VKIFFNQSHAARYQSGAAKKKIFLYTKDSILEPGCACDFIVLLRWFNVFAPAFPFPSRSLFSFFRAPAAATGTKINGWRIFGLTMRVLTSANEAG